MINVNFRVTGIYVGNTTKDKDGYLTIEVNDNPTVYDIMKAVSVKASNGEIPNMESFVFSPSNPSENDTVNAIYVVFSAPPRPNRDAGLYALQDNSTTNPITTFQYYIYDENFKQLNNNNKSKKFKQQPDEIIKDGYTVIIRQVSILMQPIMSKYIKSKIESLKLSMTEA